MCSGMKWISGLRFLSKGFKEEEELRNVLKIGSWECESGSGGRGMWSRHDR